MAKEYNELEQLVNDVTNIDTARMTLRWALERLNSVEKEKAELKKNLTIAEETGKGLEIKVRSLNESVTSRSKTLDEKEDFYDKLEATMALLGEGKLDIQQLLKKEAKLDHLRKELEDEYQSKFEELDKTQSSVIARWNQRLLDVEGQYAKRLSEAQNKYDSLRSGLEADYQGRLGALEKSYQQKEKELVERIKLLETSVKSGEGRLEGRKKELEAEFIAKKNEIEENHLKLKSLLEANLDDRVRSLDGEHAVQVKSLEKSWNMERARLLEEQRIRDEHSKNAQAEIAALEAGLAAQQEKHHGELMEAINKKEEAFRAKLQEFEAEKGEYQKVMARMADEARGKDNALLADKERLQAELMAKMLEKEDAFKAKEAALEADYAARREALGAEFSAREAALNKEAAARVEFERTAWQAQSGRLEAMLAKTGEDFKRAQKEIAELSARNRQLSEQLLDKEAVFNREMVGIKANYEKELNLRVKDTVEARTAHLLEALEAAKRRNEEASALIGARDGEIDRLNAEMAGRARQFESRLMTTGNLAISEKLAELETAYKAKKERLDSETAEMKGTLDKEYQAMRAELAGNYEVISRQAALENENLKSLVMNMRKEAYETNMKAESAFNELAALTRAHQDETRKLKEDHLSELNLRTGEAVAKASEALSEKLYFAEEGMLKLQKDNMDEIRAMQDSFQKEKERLVEDLSRRESCIEAGDIKIAQLENEMTRYRQDSAVELHGRLAEREDKFKALIREDQARQEKAEHEAAQRLEAVKNSYEARLKETEDRAGETLAKATESLGEKLYLAEEGMFKLQKDNMDEIRALQDSFQKEKERLVEDLSRRESCIEAGDVKIAQLENEIMKYRQDSSAVLHNNLTEQEDKFNALVRESQARQEKAEQEAAQRLEAVKNAYEARLKEMEAALQAREDVMRADGEVWNKKQRELDAEYSGRALGQLAEQEDRFNALLREYHARQEKLEKEAAGKLEETRREYGARLKELEEALQAKEARMRENEELWRRKQLELESGLNAGRNRLNADMLAGEQALAGKEKKLISRNLDLEKEYSAKTAEIENLRIELTRVIMDYKNRK